MDFDDVLGCLFGTFFGLIIIGLFILLCWLTVDAWQDRQSFPAQAACRAKRMEAVRQPLSTRVVCIPVNTRQDTTTVNLNAKGVQ